MTLGESVVFFESYDYLDRSVAAHIRVTTV